MVVMASCYPDDITNRLEDELFSNTVDPKQAVPEQQSQEATTFGQEVVDVIYAVVLPDLVFPAWNHEKYSHCFAAVNEPIDSLEQSALPLNFPLVLRNIFYETRSSKECNNILRLTWVK